MKYAEDILRAKQLGTEVFKNLPSSSTQRWKLSYLILRWGNRTFSVTQCGVALSVSILNYGGKRNQGGFWCEREMITRFKKNKKKRGHVNAGHGRIGKHRKHTGGRGNVGGMHHHRILFNKYHPGYFGMFYCPIVNIDKLWSMIPQDVKEKASIDNVPLIDGVLPPSQPVIVKTKLISKLAEKKIKEGNGAIVLTT
uniref:60S ribosomal protein L27a-3-like n=1 Tax=Nelumbo nucifera TaxID=4432 RepID=A0A822XZI2_NELNU|nr:TPA_asm: hypothetical protein HUJ06_027258 [Nelumbo nucifera]